MDLFLMRHADANPAGSGGDHLRALTEKGRRQAAKMAELFRDADGTPLLIVASPYVRARETAEILAGAIGKGATVEEDGRLSAGMSPHEADAAMMDYAGETGRLCLVGHNPDLERLASHLLGLEESRVEMKKGAVAAFAAVRPGFGGSVLRWLANPKLF